MASLSERYDALLAWASELGSGSWTQWQEAAATLELGPGEAARTLDQLAHVEFDWAGGRFAVAPTMLVHVQGLTGYALLAGARPVGERERLAALALDSEFDVELGAPIPQRGGRGPATVLVECAPEDAARFAALAGLANESRPELLALSLPALTIELVGELRAPDLRFPYCLIDPLSLQPRWGASDDLQTEGLWLVHSYRRRSEHYLRRDGQWWHLPIREYGPYLAAAPALEPPLLEYEQANWILHVRGRAPLPPLQARAATLCSGRMPLRRPLGDDLQLSYVNVDPQSASALAASLGAGLHTEGEA